MNFSGRINIIVNQLTLISTFLLLHWTFGCHQARRPSLRRSSDALTATQKRFQC